MKEFNHLLLWKRIFLGSSLLLTTWGVTRANPTHSKDSSKESRATSLISQQNKISISGVINDQYGPVTGANVVQKGTTNGTITDLDGKFTLDVAPGSTLLISYIGYEEQEIIIGDKRSFNITLKEDTKALEEVVVVGYGTQKKVNMSGSVASVNIGELTESRPITNVSHALAGMVAGVQVSSSSNQPGGDNAAIKIRGQGTLNSSSPLVIIDGVEAGINTVNPQDIESMSVLKDAASAAIYGSRAANGVILITTKQGKAGSLKVDYNGYISFESIRNTLTPVSNYADYMELVNEGLGNSNQTKPFSQATIDLWRENEGVDPLKYPNTNWIDETFQSSMATNHNISMSGGTDKIRFYSSFGYSNDPGVMENTAFEKYNARISVQADIKKWLQLGVQASGYVSNQEPGPVKDVFTYASATTPGMVFRAPDGRYGAMNNLEDDSQSAVNNPLRRLNSIQGNYQKRNMRTRFYGTVRPFKGFSVTASYSAEFLEQLKETKPNFIDGWNFLDETITLVGAGRSSIYNFNGDLQRNFGDIVGRYETSAFNKRLKINAMFGGSQEQYISKEFSARRYDMIDLNLGSINAAIGDATASGTSTEWAMHSFFGRLNLDWDNKYLLEANFRGDASSRFLADNRWGYFPSVSAAWRMDQEAFMESAVSGGLSNLKIRASYGSLGNNSVGNFDAISVYSIQNYVLNNSLAMGMAQTALANANLTWESTYVTDIGVDFGLFNNRFTGTVDYFHKKTQDILINLPAPSVHGTASIPKQNSATVTNQGIELSLGWQDQVSDFSYGVTGNFTYVKNIVNKFKGPGLDGRSISGANLIWEGHSINSQYLLSVDRILQTDEDMQLVQDMIDNAPLDKNGKKVNPFAAYGTPQKGDLLYKDMNGDGIINQNDRTIVSDGPNPKYYFGMNINLGYKGIDFSMLLQGVAGCEVYWQHAAYNTPTVRYGYQLNQEVMDGRWYEGRTDATYPRLLNYNDQRNTVASDFYLQDKAYLKIRNIQLGYTIPQKWTKEAHIERVRIYGSLENFFTFTKYKGFDPEVNGMNYPTMKKALVGINVTF